VFRHLRSLSFPTFAVCLGFVSGTCLAADIVILCGQSNASGRVSDGYEAMPGDAAIPFHYDTDGPVWFADAILAGTGTRLLDYALVAKPDPGGVLIRWRCPLDTTIALETTADFLTWAPLVSEQVRVSVRMREINAADSMQVFRLSVP